ncbi:site-specific DNA-methyltransferase [Clostridium estertheticum]|uniref:site-specific DNA-methyltransferase n=1 Tax=Clostridium estertheticum TaxID=238834 RepID=UPI001C0B5FA1|nr:site-specific DNA-methyltransferase [Clostridium estertheticum]MBU3172489.1 site-specific DNA-methyltransferase [Clostridium estertheticum]
MDKMKMESIDITKNNIDRVGALFPNVITEIKDENGNLRRGINFELLKQELSHDVVDGEECYDFTWVGKKASIMEGNTPIRKTLRPCIKESKEWENTENLYIEGDNLEVLKLLQESYLNSIKIIYIDPPYNTGNDFIYKDDFKMSIDEYDEQSGVFDDEENRLFKNNESNGRFHSDWCSMLYPRLKLAQNLLTYDGVVFINIDDNEVDNLRKLCDEVFGSTNRVADLIWDLKSGPQAGHFSRSHESILVYAKSKNQLPNFALESDERIVHGALKKISSANPQSVVEFPVGFEYEGENAVFEGVLGNSEKEHIIDGKMIFENGKLKYATKISAGWGMKNQLLSWIEGKETFDSKGQKVVRFYFNKNGILFYEKEKSVINPKTVINDVGGTKTGSSDLAKLFDVKIFDFPKPVELIKRFASYIMYDKNSFALDFFSGSATTAQAIMQLNAEDGGKRKFIMVQLPEECKEDSEAYKLGYNNICEIGKERIRRAGQRIIEDNKNKGNNGTLDTGFRVLKVDSTNMKEVYYAANEYTQSMLAGLESNIKDDRTDLDLLYGVLLDWGLPLSLNHKIEEIYGVTVHTVDKNSLVACFAEKVSESVVREIAKSQPLRVVFRDSSFATSEGKINLLEIFKQFFKCSDEEVRNRVKVI